MPRPRRCQPRAGQPHSWIVAGDQFVCERCKEPGPDVNDVLLRIWEARSPRLRILDERRDLLQALIERAEHVSATFEKEAAVVAAELAARGPLSASDDQGSSPAKHEDRM